MNTETLDISNQIADLITPAELSRFNSSVEISLTEGNTAEYATNRAFRNLWSHRIGYASGIRGGAWERLQEIAHRLEIEL